MVSVGRNDLCPCGSGKKYKKCCDKGSVIQLGEVIDRELVEIQDDMLSYAAEVYQDDLLDMLGDYKENLKEEVLNIFELFVLIWFTTTFAPNGKPIIEEYLDTQTGKITRPRVRDTIMNWKNATPSIYKVEGFAEGRQMLLADIFTGEAVNVRLLEELEEEEKPEAGEFVLATVLLSTPPVFFTTFLDLPFKNAGDTADSILDLFKESGHADPKAFMREEFLDVLETFMFSFDPDVSDYDWQSPKHQEVAEQFENFMEMARAPQPLQQAGILLWFKYCMKTEPKVGKTNLYVAALVLLTQHTFPLLTELSSERMAEGFGVSARTLSSKYNDMRKVLARDIEEIQIALEKDEEDWEDEDDDYFFDELLIEDEEDEASLYLVDSKSDQKKK